MIGRMASCSRLRTRSRRWPGWRGRRPTWRRHLFLLALGFIVGAWGQSARMPILVIAGILLILFAVGGFVIDNSTGGSGIPGLGGG